MENNFWVVLFSTGMKTMAGPILVSALLLCFSFLLVSVFFVPFVFSVFSFPVISLFFFPVAFLWHLKPETAPVVVKAGLLNAL